MTSRRRDLIDELTDISGGPDEYVLRIGRILDGEHPRRPSPARTVSPAVSPRDGHGTSAHGWRIRLQVELERGSRWRTLPPEDSGESLTYDGARQLAQRHANAGRRVRIVDPEGRASQDVPAEKLQPRSRRRAPAPSTPQLEIFQPRRSR